MTVVELSNGILTGLTADTKPTTYPAGTIYLDTQTGAIWMYLVSTWTAVTSASGEANTASNVGTGQGVFKAKTGVDLAFRSLTATSSKIALANNTNDVGIDVTEANLTLDNMTGPLGVAKGGTGATTLSAGVVIAAGTSAFTTKSNPAGAFLDDSTPQNVSGAKTFSNTAMIQRNPAGTFSLTWIHPAITAARDRRAYSPYKYIVVTESGTTYVKEGFTEAILNSGTSTAMIQWAMDNLTGSRTWKERVKIMGDHSISKITVPSLTCLDLQDARLFQIAATNTAMIENADTSAGNTDIEIFGGLIDGNKANQTGGGTEAISMIRMVKCNNFMIHHSKLINANFHCMRILDCPTGVIVTNNIIGNFKQEGVCDHATGLSAGAAHHHIISNNYSFHDVGQPTGSCHVSTVNIADLSCVGNVWQYNIGGSGTTFNGLRNIIAHNTITDIVGGAITLAQGAGSLFDSSGSIITGNTVKNCGLVGIHVQNAVVSNDMTISNNFVDSAGTVTNTSGGIVVQDTQGFTITGNTCKHNGGSGIFVAGASSIGGSKHGIIANNLCYDNGQGASATAYYRAGIALQTNSAAYGAYMNVHGNTCYNVTSSFQRWGVYGLTISNCNIRNNDLRGNFTDGILLSGDTGTKLYGNLGYLTEGSGSSTQSGNASTKVFNIAHGLVAAPTKYLVLPGSADAIGPYYLTADATNVIVTYPSAPPTGTSNLIFRWLAEVYA